MADEQVSIVIKAEDKASGVFKNVEQNVGGLGSAFGKLASAAAIGAAIGGVTAFLKDASDEFISAERSARQLEHAVIDVSKGTKEQVEQINQVTLALQRKAGVDADALNAGVAQLSTFGLQTDSVIRLTKSLADFTVNNNGLTASTDNYITSANTMAKALQGQFGILEKQGIRFTEAQQQMILFGSETEKVTALAEGLNQNLRETTDTVAPSFEAKVAIMNQSIGDMKETIGSAIVEAITPFITQLSEWASKPETQEKIKEIVSAIAEFIRVTLQVLKVILPPLIELLKILWGILKQLYDAWAAVWQAIGTASVKVEEFIGKIKSLVDWVANAIQKLKDLAAQMGAGIIGNVQGTFNNIVGGTKNLLGFAEGGIVPGAIGAPVPAIVHGGERIIPNGENSGGVSIVITGNTFLDENMAERVAELLVNRLKLNVRI